MRGFTLTGSNESLDRQGAPVSRMPKYAKSRDENENPIVKGLEDIPGVEVWRLDTPCDLLVGYQARNYLLEVKMPGKENRKDQEEQRKWRQGWPGQITVVTNIDEALNVVLRSYRS